jgi:hypothetical protein
MSASLWPLQLASTQTDLDLARQPTASVQHLSSYAIWLSRRDLAIIRRDARLEMPDSLDMAPIPGKHWVLG